ncbi:MAG: hypothetical protein ACLRSE_11525 [Alistipes finegoldii]
MEVKETLAALEQVLLAARIANVSGTEDQWATANPVLLDGEIGLVKGTSPLKFKVGDGTKKWSQLGWGQPTTLARLAADATHRLVTDTQIEGWNNKAEKTAASTTADGLMSAADKKKLDGIAAGANNYQHPATHPATMITEDSGHRFVTDAEKAKWNEEYTIEKVATESGFASTYHLKKGADKVGVSINIPLDQVLKSSSIKTVVTANSPYSGAKVGDKYIEFLFQNNNTPQYLPVQDLVDVYTGDDQYIQVTESNVIKLNYSVLALKLAADMRKTFDQLYDEKGAGEAAAKAAIDEFKASTFVIQCTIPGMN